MDKIVIACMIKNCVAIICFTILAIVFNKWWIIFFAYLFLTSYTRTETEEKESNKNDKND